MFSAWMLVVYSFGIGLSMSISYNIVHVLVTKPESSNHFAVSPYFQNDVNYLKYFVGQFQSTVLLCLYPIFGWFADVKIGRYRSVILSVWSCWFGTCLQLLSYCIQYGTYGLPVNIAKYGLSGLALTFIMFGIAAFSSNAFAFGMDQLCDGSSAQIRAFIHWMIWGLFLGFSTDYTLFHKSVTNSLLIQITGIVTVFFLTVIVCINIVFKDKFIKSGVLKKNPYKMVFEVIKYAKQHKFPVKRSALTYWQNKSPSRIEFGKEKYGGPFKEEEVEDVTSFLRICIVLLSMFGLYIPYYTVILGGIFPYINKLEGSNTINGYGSYILWDSFDKTILVVVPLFELLIIPCFPKIEYFLLKPLRWIGISHILLLLSLISMFVIDTVHDLKKSDVICSLNSPTSSHNYYFLYYMIPFSLIGVIEIITFIYSFEFICSQAPANMNGMLIGIFWFIRELYINIGAIITTPFFKGLGNLTCTFWPLLLQLFILVIGGAVYIVVIKRYQKRQKGDTYDLQKTVESYYVHMMLEQEKDAEIHQHTVVIID